MAEWYETDHRAQLLLDSLEVGVLIETSRLLEASWWEVERVVAASQAILIEGGEGILFRLKDKTRTEFSALARAIAAMSFVPGGVRFLGRRWIETHPEAMESGWYAQCHAGGRNAWGEVARG